MQIWTLENTFNESTKRTNMRHCHFSILYNELPFLKQKMDFLYRNFDQLIFFDLNVCAGEPHNSNDGSYEFLRDYDDIENKITLIDMTDLSSVTEYCGSGSVAKQKMFAVGSEYVWDDIDVFWCTDMDEFFNESLIRKVEDNFNSRPDVNSIDVEHYIFWKNFCTILASTEADTDILYARIARHHPGNLYGHCSLQDQFKNTHFIESEKYYHFSWVGDGRFHAKVSHYTTPPTGNPYWATMYEEYVRRIWNSDYYRSIQLPDDGETLVGYPHMHPNFLNIKRGIKAFRGKLPDYIDVQELERDINIDTSL